MLRGKSEIMGDITAPLLNVDAGVSIIGILDIAFASSQIPIFESRSVYFSPVESVANADTPKSTPTAASESVFFRDSRGVLEIGHILKATNAFLSKFV